jgi:hypothetical protein
VEKIFEKALTTKTWHQSIFIISLKRFLVYLVMEGVDGSLLVVSVDIPAGQHMLQAHQVTIPVQRSKN